MLKNMLLLLLSSGLSPSTGHTQENHDTMMILRAAVTHFKASGVLHEESSKAGGFRTVLEPRAYPEKPVAAQRQRSEMELTELATVLGLPLARPAERQKPGVTGDRVVILPEGIQTVTISDPSIIADTARVTVTIRSRSERAKAAMGGYSAYMILLHRSAGTWKAIRMGALHS